MALSLWNTVTDPGTRTVLFRRTSKFVHSKGSQSELPSVLFYILNHRFLFSQTVAHTSPQTLSVLRPSEESERIGQDFHRHRSTTPSLRYRRPVFSLPWLVSLFWLECNTCSNKVHRERTKLEFQRRFRREWRAAKRVNCKQNERAYSDVGHGALLPPPVCAIRSTYKRSIEKFHRKVPFMPNAFPL